MDCVQRPIFNWANFEYSSLLSWVVTFIPGVAKSTTDMMMSFQASLHKQTTNNWYHCRNEWINVLRNIRIYLSIDLKIFITTHRCLDGMTPHYFRSACNPSNALHVRDVFNRMAGGWGMLADKFFAWKRRASVIVVFTLIVCVYRIWLPLNYLMLALDYLFLRLFKKLIYPTLSNNSGNCLHTSVC